MMKQIFSLLTLALIVMMMPVMAEARVPATLQDESTATVDHDEKSGSVDAQSIIFEHLGDRYGWEMPFNHHKSIPLPVIVWGSDGLHVFSSARVDHGKTYRDGNCDFRIAGVRSRAAAVVPEVAVVGPFRYWVLRLP